MELRAEDLRCNNYVHLTKDDFKTVKVYQLDAYDIYKLSESDCFDVKPIPLTEEWLLKFNAIKMHSPYLGFKYSRFKLIWKESYKFWYVLDWVDETYMTKIQYVHEFQNFIKSMDNKELQVL